MLASLFRTQPAYPHRQCFFCHTTSVILPPYDPHAAPSHPPSPRGDTRTPSTSALTISSGTATNWLCSSCHCQNTYTNDGAFQQHYTRPMWDEQWNNHRNSLQRHLRRTSDHTPHHQQHQNTTPHSTAAAPPPPPPVTTSDAPPPSTPTFCHTCRTNQTLQVSLLADYLPDESDPEYPQRLADLPAYSASIAARYPTVCDRCAPAVQEAIQQRDRMARSWTLAQWLAKRGSEAASPPAKGSYPPAPHTQPGAPSEAVSTNSTQTQPHRFSTLHWSYQAACWLSSTAVMLFLPAVAAIRPDAVRDALIILEYLVHEEPLSSASLLVVCSLLLLLKALLTGNGWDPTANRVATARRRGVRPEVLGLDTWQTHQSLLFVVRLVILAAVLGRLVLSSANEAYGDISSDRDWTIASLGLGALVTELVLLFLSVRGIAVRMPPHLRLVSKPLYAARSSEVGSSARGVGGTDEEGGTSEAFHSLSLDESRQRGQTGIVAAATLRPPPTFTAINSDDRNPAAEERDPTAFTLPNPQRDRDGDEIMHYSPPPSSTSLGLPPTLDDDGSDDEVFHSAPPSSFLRDRGRGVGWPSTTAGGSSTSSSAAAATTATAALGRRTEAYEFQLAPQRFWEPQVPTGLEEVFGKAVRLGDEEKERERVKEEEEREGEGEEGMGWGKRLFGRW